MANIVSPIVIINKNKIQKKKTADNSSKRALSSTSTNSPDHEDKKGKFFVSANRFQALATDEADEQDNVFATIEDLLVTQPNESSTKQSNVKLPNIVLTNINDFSIIRKDLTRIVGPEGFTCKAIKSNIIIRSNTRVNFMAIKSYLIETGQEYHSYLPRSSQPFRVVLHHLHDTIPTTDIINCLNDVGHKVISIINITHSANKLPLPLFNISLARNTNNREIFKITKLLNT